MTRKKILILFGGLLLIFFFALSIKIFVLDKQNSSGSLQIDAIPRSKIFLNDAEVGQTPYLGENLKPGEFKLKLGSWETKVKVSPNQLTYVSRGLGSDLDDSAGQILFLEKLPSNSTELTVVSDPDGATVTIDSLPKGQTSLLLRDLPLGDRIITISKDGFADQVVRSKMVAGFRLNAIVKLKKINTPLNLRPTADLIATTSGQVAGATTSAATNSQILTKPYITVRDNPLGFLKVHSGPDFFAPVTGKIYPGEKYSLAAQSDNWAKIKWATGTGWVWEDYVVVEQ